MKPITHYTRELAECIIKTGRRTAERALDTLRMLLLLPLIASASIAFAAGEAEAYDLHPAAPLGAGIPPGYTGIGPVEQGSVDYESIPARSRKFLQKNCDGHAIVRCDKLFSSGKYSISLADGINMDFDAKGNIVSIQAPDGYSLSPTLLRAVVPGKLFRLLEHNGLSLIHI